MVSQFIKSALYCLLARAVKSPSRIKCGRPSETLSRSRIAYKQHLPVESQRPERTESNLFIVNASPLVDLHLIFEKSSWKIKSDVFDFLVYSQFYLQLVNRPHVGT